MTRLQALCQKYTDVAINALVEIMNDRTLATADRCRAATEIINRGLGPLAEGHTRFVIDNRDYYVYSIHDRTGRLIYIGKGCKRRNHVSANRFKGTSRIRAVFSSEKQALAFEARLIKRFRPRNNLVHIPTKLRSAREQCRS